MRLLISIVGISLVVQGCAAVRSHHADRAEAATSGLRPDSDAAQSPAKDVAPGDLEEILHDELEEGVDKVQEGLSKSANRTLSEMQHIDEVPNELRRALEMVLVMFLPKWHFKEKIFWEAAVTVFASLAWFYVYFGMLLKRDRSESLDRWHGSLMKMQKPDANTIHLSPDLILVFHHPKFEYNDGKKEVHPASIDRVLSQHQEYRFPRVRELRSSMMVRRMSSSLERAATATKALIGAPADTLAVPNHMVRTAMLQDLYEAFQSWGFNVKVFSSVDNDQIFFCASLRSVPVIRHYLSQGTFPLQLRSGVVKKLGIKQNPSDPASSPPSVPYDKHLVERLSEHGVLDSADESELFQTFTGTATFVSSLQCLDIMWDNLVGSLDPYAAIDEGFLVALFPAHNPTRIAELKATWANWRYLLDLSFVQPLPQLRNYFGTRITFIFGWNGHYCKALLALVTVALLMEVICRVGNSFAIPLLKTRQVLGFSIVLVVWAKICENLWHREQDFFTELWNLRHHCSVRTIRPQFQGEQKASPVDESITEKQYPKHLSFYRQLLTGCFTVFFCGLVACCIFVWMLIFKGKVDVVSSVMLSLQIKVLEFVFHTMVPILTDFENHKHQDEYHNSLLWKLFAFDFVNNYSAFFSLTIRFAWGCDHGDCLFVLRRQVSVCLSILCACSIASMLMNGVIVRLSLWYEAYQLQKQTGSEMPERYFLEEQAKYAVINEQEEVQNMLTLVISLGFVLLFGGVAPLVVPCCLCVFAMQLRAFAVFLTTDAQRPHPQDSAGIGNWHSCIRFLMLVGVFYAGLLFVAFGPTFKGTSLMAKSTGLVCFCLASAMLWALIDIVCPPTDSETDLLAKRREHVLTKLMKSAGPGVSSPSEDPLALEPLKQSNYIVDAAWDKIPNLQLLRRSSWGNLF
uniref:Anoctamin transmembrane domain-containing protein n=1 Tax=Pyrodinium bahamense TaxID=73915 RepID=A0A7S0A3I1_9DINO|mmetsp:Transcript_20797/g.57584  ORF Transcript_20797/g.57584 Transcript_20797/m.57584 type:complete len:912 (+) Transcript_20797:79-2814(+)